MLIVVCLGVCVGWLLFYCDYLFVCCVGDCLRLGW